MKFLIGYGIELPKPDVGGRPGIAEHQKVALERGRKLCRFGLKRVEAAAKIHKEYYGNKAIFIEGKPKPSQISYLSKRLS